MVGEYTATDSYCFLLLLASPVRVQTLALTTPSSKLSLSPTVSHCPPLSAALLCLLSNHHPHTAQISWGVRFDTMDDANGLVGANTFLNGLCSEVGKRLMRRKPPLKGKVSYT